MSNLNFKCCVPAPKQDLKKGVYGLVGVKETFWEQGELITYSFLGGNGEQQELWKKALGIWAKYVGLKFEEKLDPRQAEVRVSFVRGIGSWSYLGTQCRIISNRLEATMNLGWDDEGTYLHEIGHMLGFGHEHQNPKGGIQWNLEQLIADLSGPPNSWSIQQINHNVVDAYSDDEVRGSEVDKLSVMMYPIPQRWTIGNFSTANNDELSNLDKEYAGKIYPKLDEEEDEPTVEVDPKILIIKALKLSGVAEKELRRLYKSTLVRIAELVGIQNPSSKWKRCLASEIMGKVAEVNTDE